MLSSASGDEDIRWTGAYPGTSQVSSIRERLVEDANRGSSRCVRLSFLVDFSDCSTPKQRSEQIIRRGYSEGERRRAIPRGFDGSPQRNVEGRSQTGWVLAMLRPKQETDHSPY